jgi:transposase InsO family protein
VSQKTAGKWVGRFRTAGLDGLVDRSSRPHRIPRQTSSCFVEQVLVLRRQHMAGYQIARRTGLSPASVSRILRRARLSRWRDLNPPPPVVRYEHPHPGDLLHLDIKGMTRFGEVSLRGDGRLRGKRQHPGSLALHVAVDDHSRIAYTAILPDQTHHSAMRFFLMARAHFNRFGFSIRRVLTDNGSCYRDGRFRQLLHRQHVKHRFTRPYTPRTNGKAERFIQTALREWAYARSYQNSEERYCQLEPWLHDYNFHRPHTSLKLNTPASRSGLNRNNLLSLHS